MMRASLLVLSLSATISLLSACGDKPQSAGGVKGDVAAYQGVENKYAAPGWKAGDKTSWEQGLKARMQNSQNEYSKTGAPVAASVAVAPSK
jgi:outer membrane lipopolysaccharide assembly protein LptE/RlpB